MADDKKTSEETAKSAEELTGAELVRIAASGDNYKITLDDLAEWLGDGVAGWSPVLALVIDGARRVLQVTDWVGGTGTKPATGNYIGPSGLTPTIGSAVDVRGAAGATGSAGTNGAPGADGADGVLASPGYNYVIVEAGANATTNGTNLVAGYAAAKALTPGGNSLSATNRACVLLMPGTYQVTDGALMLDTSFVDIIGWNDKRDETIIVSNGVTLRFDSAIEAEIANIVLQSTWNSSLAGDNTDKAPLFFQGDSLVSATNCEFRPMAGKPSMRTHTDLNTGAMSIGYSPTIKGCLAANMAFGFLAQSAGNYEDCIALDASYGYGSNALGVYKRCKGQAQCFAGGANDTGVAQGVFIDCEAADQSFGGNGTASGTFIRCTAGSASFASSHALCVCSGTFIDCLAGNDSFGMNGTTTGCTGTFIGCAGGDNAFAGLGGVASGTFKNCTGGTGSFAGGDGTASGSFDNIKMTGLWDTIFSGQLRNSTIEASGSDHDGISDVRADAVIERCKIIATGTGLSLNTTETEIGIKASYSSFSTPWSTEISNSLSSNTFDRHGIKETHNIVPGVTGEAKVYDAIISQASTSEPAEDATHESALGAPVVYTYVDVGKYNIQVPGSTGWANTSIYLGQAFGGMNPYTLSCDPTFSDNFQLQVFDAAGANVDSGLTLMPILIKVY